MQRSVAIRKRATFAAILVAIVAASACVTVEYVRPGRPVAERAGSAVVFTRIRFMYDGREWFPWDPSFLDVVLHTEEHRHFWLRQLDRTAASPELQPDSDGSLAVRLAPGDYALLGTEEDIADISGVADFEVVALLRVPGEHPVLYAGDLVLMTRYQEGWSVVTRRLGEPVVDKEPLAVATARIEAKYGPLPAPLAAAYWCAGQGVPVQLTPESFAASRELLERGCAPPP